MHDSSRLAAARSINTLSHERERQEILLQVDDLTVDYGVGKCFQPALDSITFEIGRAEVVGILGESGSGKTTLALALLRLLPSSARILRGTIRFGGRDLLALKESELEKIRGAQISMIFQEPEMALNPVMQAIDQVAEVLAAHHEWKRTRCRAEAERILTEVRFEPDRRLLSAYPHQLSGGQRQRLVLAQALACRPQLLIADEPTASLDSTLQVQWLSLMKHLQKRLGLAVLLITHDPAILSGLADRILVLYRGQIIEAASSDRLLRNPLHPSTQALLRSTPPQCGELPRSTKQLATDESSSPTNPQRPALVASHLKKTYKQSRWFARRGSFSVAAIRDVSLSIGCGRFVGLVGESGSGKSTFARCLACLERPDEGQVWMDGRNLLSLNSRELRQARRQIQIVFQGSAATLNPRFSGLEIVAEPLTILGLGKQERRERALALMESVGLPPQLAGRVPSELSGGQRHRLAIARVLALRPKWIILDESMRGLDLPVQAQIINLLMDLQASLAIGYLFISHDLRLIAQYADHLAVMEDGYIIEQGPAQVVLSNPQDARTRALLAAAAELRLDRVL